MTSRTYHWYYLKMGQQSSDLWRLDAPQPTAAIYFGRSRVKKLVVGTGDRQAVAFCQCGEPPNRNRTRMVVMAGADIWILKPNGSVYEEEPIPRRGGIVKVMPVKVVARTKMITAPAVLAGLRSNKFLGLGTFRPIGNWGNIKALHSVLGEDLPKEQLLPENCTPPQLIECLGSIELETLLAKLLEAAGCFVPAFRGGNLIAADVFAHNTGARKIDLDGLVVPSRQCVSIQVKGWSDRPKDPSVDYLFRLPNRRDLEKGEFSADWLLGALEKRRGEPSFDHVRSWLHLSLARWLPKSFLGQYGLS
jgi:hypothetical protein